MKNTVHFEAGEGSMTIYVTKKEARRLIAKYDLIPDEDDDGFSGYGTWSFADNRYNLDIRA